MYNISQGIIHPLHPSVSQTKTSINLGRAAELHHGPERTEQKREQTNDGEARCRRCPCASGSSLHIPRARLFRRDSVDVAEANVGGVEAVCLVDLSDFRVAWLSEFNIDA